MTSEYNIYLDCFSGASGDMIIGALLDTGMGDISYLKEELNKVGIEDYSIDVKKVTRGGISGTKFTVMDEGVTQPMRTLPDLLKLVQESDLSEWVKEKAGDIFTNLAKAEAKVHDIHMDKVHFHEVGAVDTLVDVLGSLILMEKMGVEGISASKVHTGIGFIDCEHGTLPVPAPATLELLKGVPVYSSGVESELVTPTGAALLKTLSSSFGDMPDGEVVSVGYGAGYKELDQPNLLRAVWLKKIKNSMMPKITVLETNIDDMNPEVYSYLFEKLFEAGALDVALTPIYMKKNRPASKLTVLCNSEITDSLLDILLKETSTFGVRILEGNRICLEREIVEVETRYGALKVKVGSRDGKPMTISPEYDHCAEIARKEGVALREVYRAAIRSAEEIYRV